MCGKKIKVNSSANPDNRVSSLTAIDSIFYEANLPLLNLTEHILLGEGQRTDT